MKAKFLTLIGAGILSLMPACMSESIVLPPVGPLPVEAVHAPKGLLQVHSETESVQDGDFTYYYPHTGYNICDQSGKTLRYIPNHAGNMDQVPTLVKIPPGSYNIKARSSSYGWVTVPVVVKQGKVTVVHLENDWRPTALSSYLVHLPDGEPVGWRASID